MKKKNSEKRKLYLIYLNSIEWEEKRKLVLSRENNCCQKCKSTMQLQIHHGTYVRLFNEDLSDLYCLCTNCHNLLHKPYGTKDLLRVTKCFISGKEYIPKQPRIKKIKTKVEKVAAWKKKQRWKKKKERKLVSSSNAPRIKKRKELPPKPTEYYYSFKGVVVLKKWKLGDTR